MINTIILICAILGSLWLIGFVIIQSVKFYGKEPGFHDHIDLIALTLLVGIVALCFVVIFGLMALGLYLFDTELQA